MARRDRVSKADAGRKPSQEVPVDTYWGAIESERTRLMKAESVLGSVAFALNHAEWQCESGADYANVVEIAREIVQESIVRLESINLRRSVGNGAEA